MAGLIVFQYIDFVSIGPMVVGGALRIASAR